MSAPTAERTPNNYVPAHEYVNGEELAVAIPDDASELTRHDYAERGATLARDIAETVSALTENRVPKSVEDAEDTAAKLQNLATAVGKDLLDKPELAEHVESDVLDSLHEAADLSVDNWRLDSRTRKFLKAIKRAESVDMVPGYVSKNYLHAEMGRLSQDDSETTSIKFARLREHAEARLGLHDAIMEKYHPRVAATKPQTAAAVATPKGAQENLKTAPVPPKKAVRRAERPVTTIGKPAATETAEQEYIGRHRGAENPTATAEDDYVGRHRAHKGASRRREGINDLVSLDAHGRAHYESGVDRKGKNIKGRFMTKHELDTIEAHQDLIRDGLATRDEVLPNDAKQVEPLPVSADFPLTTTFSPQKTTAEMAGDSEPTVDTAPKYTRAVWDKMTRAQKAAARRDMASRQEAWLDQQRPDHIEPEVWSALNASDKNRIVDLSESKKELLAWADVNQPKHIADTVWSRLPAEEKIRLTEVTFERANEVNAEWDAATQAAILASRPEVISEEAWLDISPAGRDRVLAQLEASKAQQGAESGEDAEVHAARSRWGRVKNLLHKLSPFTLERDGEKAKKEVIFHRKRAAALSGVLAVSLLAGAVAANQSEEAPRDNVASAEAFAHEAAAGAAVVAGQVAGELSDAAGLAKAEQAKAAAAKAAAEKAVQKTVAFKSGDTVWEAAEMQLKAKGNKQPTVEQIDALKDHLLEINGLTEESAKLIPIGFKLKV